MAKPRLDARQARIRLASISSGVEARLSPTIDAVKTLVSQRNVVSGGIAISNRTRLAQPVAHERRRSQLKHGPDICPTTLRCKRTGRTDSELQLRRLTGVCERCHEHCGNGRATRDFPPWTSVRCSHQLYNSRHDRGHTDPQTWQMSALGAHQLHAGAGLCQRRLCPATARPTIPRSPIRQAC